jgi:hypothetical protein
MPKRLPEDIPHEQWTDHRIVRESADLALQPAISDETSLIAVPGIVQHPSSRDVAMAYYDIVAHGDVALLKRARSLLEAATQPDAADSDLLTASGVVAQMEDDRAAAAGAYRRALGRNPDDYKAAMNLGVLLVRSGQAGEVRSMETSVLAQRGHDRPRNESRRCPVHDWRPGRRHGRSARRAELQPRSPARQAGIAGARIGSGHVRGEVNIPT